LKIKAKTNFDFTTYSPSWELAIGDFITANQAESSLELADVTTVAKDQTGVDNIDLTTAVITPVGGGSKTAQGDILMTQNTYMSPGTITLIPWT
jgi:hypothetical protein